MRKKFGVTERKETKTKSTRVSKQLTKQQQIMGDPKKYHDDLLQFFQLSQEGKIGDLIIRVPRDQNNTEFITFYCHRHLLRHRLPYIAGAFDFNGNTIQDTMTLTGLTPSAVEEILKYAYSGKIALCGENLFDVLVAAIFLGVDSEILPSVRSFVRASFTEEFSSVSEILFGALEISCVPLITECLNYISSAINVIPVENYTKLPLPALIKLVSTDNFLLNEYKIFQICVQVCEKTPDILPEDLKKLFSAINYWKMTLEELMDVKNSGVPIDEIENWAEEAIQAKKNKSLLDSLIGTPRGSKIPRFPLDEGDSSLRVWISAQPSEENKANVNQAKGPQIFASTPPPILLGTGSSAYIEFPNNVGVHDFRFYQLESSQVVFTIVSAHKFHTPPRDQRGSYGESLDQVYHANFYLLGDSFNYYFHGGHTEVPPKLVGGLARGCVQSASVRLGGKLVGKASDIPIWTDKFQIASFSLDNGEPVVFDRIGRDRQYCHGFFGQVKEILVFNRPLTVTELEAIEKYLSLKWDIPMTF